MVYVVVPLFLILSVLGVILTSKTVSTVRGFVRGELTAEVSGGAASVGGYFTHYVSKLIQTAAVAGDFDESLAQRRAAAGNPEYGVLDQQIINKLLGIKKMEEENVLLEYSLKRVRNCDSGRAAKSWSRQRFDADKPYLVSNGNGTERCHCFRVPIDQDHTTGETVVSIAPSQSIKTMRLRVFWGMGYPAGAGLHRSWTS